MGEVRPPPGSIVFFWRQTFVGAGTWRTPWRDLPPRASEGLLGIACEAYAGAAPLSVAVVGTFDTTLETPLAPALNVAGVGTALQGVADLSPQVALRVAGGALTQVTASAWLTPKRA